MELWMSLIDRFGIPMAVLFALVLAIWRVARWLAPRADKALDGHMEFLRVNTDINRGMLDTQKSLERTIEAHHEAMTEKVDDIRRIVRGWHEKGNEKGK